MKKRIKPVTFFFFLQTVLFIFSSQVFADEKKITNPLKASLVYIGSSYKNQCIQKKEKCNEYVKRVGLGLIFKINLNKPHYFVATTSHLTQGNNLFIHSLNGEIKYEPQPYKVGNKTHYLRSINNDEDIEVIEIENPNLDYYFEHNPPVKDKKPQPENVVRMSSNAICTKVDKVIARNLMEPSTSLTSELIGVNLNEQHKQLSPFLKFILDQKNSSNHLSEWPYPLNFLQTAILSTQFVYYVFDLKKSALELNNYNLYPNLFLVEVLQNIINGYQQVDAGADFDRKPEYTWNMNDMFLNHFIFRGQSGTPYFYQLRSGPLCFTGLIKGFHRFFRKAYTNDIDGSNLIPITVEKLKRLAKSPSVPKDVKLTETFGQSYWFMKDEETFRKFKTPLINKEISELTSWYGPSGGSDTSDGGGSDTSDGGGESPHSNTAEQGLYPDLKAMRPLTEILSLPNNPGVNVGEDIVLGIDVTINDKVRNLYANMNSFKLLNSQETPMKASYIKLKDLEDKNFLFNRINNRLEHLKEYFDQLKRYQMIIMNDIFSRKSLLTQALHLFYAFLSEQEQDLSQEERNAILKTSKGFLKISETIDALQLQILKLLANKDATTLPYCQIKLTSDSIQLKVHKGLDLKADFKGDNMVALTSQFSTHFLNVTLNPKLQVVSMSSDEGAYDSLTPPPSQGLDLRPKFFLKKGSEKNYENLFILDVKGLLFLDLSKARIHLTAHEDQLTTYRTIKNRLPLLVEEPFNTALDANDKLIQYSPEASVLSRVAHITYKPIGSFKEYMIPCYVETVR